MKKTVCLILIVIGILLLHSIAFSWSDNVCTTENWSIKYQKGLGDDRIYIYVENISGQTAFKITYVIYYWDYSGKLLARQQGFLPGPIHSFFNLSADPPKGAQVSSVTGEIYNTWTYGQ